MNAARQSARELRIAEIAEQIVADIRKRRLQPGEPYLTTAACARSLGVSTALANRAMQLLELRGVLRRSQRAGSVVGGGEDAGHQNAHIRRISLVFDAAGLGERSGTAEEMLGIQEIFPAAAVKVEQLPANGKLAATRKLLAATRAPSHGFILWSVSLEIQRLCIESGHPFILRGNPYPSLPGLPHIGWDSFDSGQRLAAHATQHPCRGLLILMREIWRPGDNPFMDGALHAATQAGLRGEAVCVRGIGADALAVRAEVTAFLDRHPHGSGIIALMGRTGIAAHQAVQQHPHGAASRLVIADCSFEHPFLAQCAHLRYPLPFREVGRRAGALLASVIRGTHPAGGKVVLPTEIRPSL